MIDTKRVKSEGTQVNKHKKVSCKKIVGGRIVAALPIVVLQVAIIVTLLKWLAPFATYIYSVLSVLAVLFVLYIVETIQDGAYKTLWLMVMLLAPLPGALAYLLYGNKRTGRKLAQRIGNAAKEMPIELLQDEAVIKEVMAEDKRMAQTFSYVTQISGFPIVRNESAEYYPIGEALFEEMKIAMRAAKKYIYIEYFIVQEGVMWGSMLDIIEEKMKEGVDVRVLYDDIGSIGTFSTRNFVTLLKKGIKCVKFNPLIKVSGALNNRDHRKILVVDGMVAFSGGINLADEYINVEKPYGHWKDIGFRITGEAVKSYTYMFVEFWNAFSTDKITEEQLRIPESAQVSEYVGNGQDLMQAGEGYVQPYYDSPNRTEPLSNQLYIDLLGQAKDYIWFYTPYLLPGDALRQAIVHTVKRGVDVRIITPGIPDKKVVFRMSRSYYGELLKAGVKIYEYTPGFVHAKACIMDDVVSTVGTVNLDYRSLYLHYECNALFYRAGLVQSLKKDFIDTMEKSQQRGLEMEKKGFLYRLINCVLRLFAPLI